MEGGTAAMIRVLVVDDHPLVLRGTCDLLGEDPDIEVVGQAADGDAAVNAAGCLEPDVILMDVAMPLVDGVEATRRLRKRGLKVGILMLSAGSDDEQILAALRAGADGYLVKNAPDELITRAVRLVADRRPAFLQPEVNRALVVGAARGASAGATPPGAEALSERESAVLRQLARDQSNKEIASRLGISDRTVQQHLASIYGKLGVSSRTGAVLRALVLGLLALEDCRP